MQTLNAQRNTQGSSATQEAPFQAGPSAPSCGSPSGKEGRPSESEDPDPYGCRIVEEPPSTQHEEWSGRCLMVFFQLLFEVVHSHPNSQPFHGSSSQNFGFQFWLYRLPMWGLFTPVLVQYVNGSLFWQRLCCSFLLSWYFVTMLSCLKSQSKSVCWSFGQCPKQFL